MLPRINLTDPRVQELLEGFKERARTAYACSEALADAVRPVFALDSSQRRFEQVGSCVLVSIRNELFAFSASHVFERVGEYQVPVGCGDEVHYLAGDRFSSVRGSSGTHEDDPIDASVLHIAGPVAEILRTSALGFDQIIAPGTDDGPSFCSAIGFRVSQAMRSERGLSSRQEIFPTIEVEGEVYQALGIDRQLHAVLAYDSELLVAGKWQKSPSPRGVSGGAMVSVAGLPADPYLPVKDGMTPHVVAIVCELRKATAKVPQVLVGTRVGVHLGLIDQYLPGLLPSMPVVDMRMRGHDDSDAAG